MKVTNLEILNWLSEAKMRENAAILLSNNYADPYGEFEAIAAFGAKQIFTKPDQMNGFDGIALGHISYQYKNQIEHVVKCPSKSTSEIPDFLFFEPEMSLFIRRDGRRESFGSLKFENGPLELDADCKIGSWKETTSKEKYLRAVEKIREDIRNGVYYELNYCISFSAYADLDPYVLFYYFNELAPSPFAAFYKFGDHFLLCASPERFLKKTGQLLISQPIKGTRKRVIGEEEVTIAELKNHPKDLAENTMIVDLVRNDLSKICRPSTVKVPELCGIHTFSHVHQMISTVSGELELDKDFKDIIHALFPMGSMTGAPKIEVMKHIDEMEDFSRELYSGCVGYLKDGNFDFNVVIRSLMYRRSELIYSVGGAITYDSLPEDEYDECLTKASGIMGLLAKNAKNFEG